jgi:hypothetical protein
LPFARRYKGGDQTGLGTGSLALVGCGPGNADRSKVSATEAATSALARLDASAKISAVIDHKPAEVWRRPQPSTLRSGEEDAGPWRACLSP